MQKLCQYLKSGNGRGLRFVLYVSLLLSIVFGALIYSTGRQFIEAPFISKFVDSIPSFSVKDGTIQNPNLKWGAYIPLTNYPIVIDTTQDALSAPVPDGLYITRKHLYRIANHGLQIDRSEFASDMIVSPAWIHTSLYQLVVSFAIGFGLFMFFASWIGFLVAVALTTLFALIIHADLSNKRVWRVATFTWIIAQLISMTLSAFNIVTPWWAILIIVAFNVAILIKLKD